MKSLIDWFTGRQSAKAVHSTEEEVFDTHRWFGKQKCDLAGVMKPRIDERNLSWCSWLGIHLTGVRTLDTSQLQNLTSLLAYKSKLENLNTEPLTRLKILSIYNTPIAALETRWLPELTLLEAQKTKIAALETDALQRLEVLNLSYCPIAELDTTHLTALRELRLWKTRVSALNTQPLKNLTWLSIGMTPVRFLDLRRQTRLTHFFASPQIKVLDLSRCQSIVCINVVSSGVQKIGVADRAFLAELWLNDCKIRYLSLPKPGVSMYVGAGQFVACEKIKRLHRAAGPVLAGAAAGGLE